LAFSPRDRTGSSSGFGYAPTVDAYAAMVHCFGLAKDDASMLAALLELCAAPGLGGAPEGVVDVAAKHMSISIGRTDDAFYLLQQMHAAHAQAVLQAEATAAAAASAAGGAGGQGSPAAEAPAASSASLPARAVHVAALNAVIRACALQGSLERAFATFDALSDFGLKPNDRTFAGLLQACAGSSKDQQHPGVAAALLEEMRSRYGLEPGPAEHHWAVLAMAQAGHWKEAEELLERAGYRGFAMTATRLQLAHVKLNERDVAGAKALVNEVHESGARLPAPLLHRLKTARETASGGRGGGSGMRK
jgi:pentatricopeptide repeat protein